MLPIRFKLFLFLLVLMLIIAGGMQLFMEQHAGKAFYERESVAARNILRLVMGDISHYYRNKVSYKLETLVRKRELMREAVGLAVSHVASLHALSESGALGEDEARDAAEVWLRRERFADEERFIAFNSSLRGIVHSDREWEGLTWSGFLNLKGRDALKQVVAAVKDKGEEFTVMHWIGQCELSDTSHLAYFSYFRPWDWVVGTTLCLDRIERDIEAMDVEYVKHLQEFIVSASSELDGSLAIIDADGAVVAASGLINPVEEAGGQEGVFRENSWLEELQALKGRKSPGSASLVLLQTPKGAMEYAVFADNFKALDWTVYYVVSRQNLLQPARNLMKGQLQLLLAIFIVGLFPLFFLVRRITVPLTVLAEYARALPERDFRTDDASLAKVREIAGRQTDEAGQLAEAFAAMQSRLEGHISDLTRISAEREVFARQLQDANETLERRVNERTRALHQANLELLGEIEERMVVTRQLAERNAQLQGIFDNAPLLIWLKDTTGRITLANTRFLEFFGVTGEQIGGARLEELFQGDLARFSSKDLDVLRMGRPKTEEERVHLERGMAALITTRFPLVDDEGSVFALCGVAQDVTETKLLEAEALRASHLAALGELSAIVAHEINNPINGIINFAEIMVDAPSDAENVEKFSRLIVTEGDRISNIVNSLLSYVRDRNQGFRPVELKALLDEVLLLNNLQFMKHSIRLELESPEETLHVKGDAQELKQVFLNIINNAREALDEKYPGTDQNKELRILLEALDEERALISFIDRGPGISPEDLPRVFDSFYTTKTASQGTGLGLYISNRIVANHGGEMRISSEYGEYTRVDVELPLWSGGGEE